MVIRHVLPGGIIGYQMGLGRRPRMTVWCYRVGSTLIDAGTPRVLNEFLPVVLADGPLTHIYVTHHHEDHSGGAARLREATGARVVLSPFCAPLTRHGFRQHPYQLWFWGRFRPYHEDEVLALPPLGETRWSTPDGDFIILHAPGHSHDMTVVWLPERRALVAADLYLASRLKYMRRDEVWEALEASLGRVLARTRFEMLLCGHRPLTSGGYAALEKKHRWMQESRRSFSKLLATGLSPDAATRQVFGPAGSSFGLFSLGDVSQRNMLRSLVGELKPRPDVLRRVGEAWARCEFD